MLEYITLTQAMELIDKSKVKEGYSSLSRFRLILDRMIFEGRIFYVILGNKVMLQKASFIETFPDLLKPDVLGDGMDVKPKDLYFPKPHLCRLQKEDAEVIYQGNMLIDDVFCDYFLSLRGMKMSLEKEGLYDIIICTCGHIECGGRSVEVKHLEDDVIAWAFLYYQDIYPVKSLDGYLIAEEDYRDYVRIIADPHKPHKRDLSKESWKKARDIVHKGKKVIIPLPLFFSRTQLEELIDSYSK